MEAASPLWSTNRSEDVVILHKHQYSAEISSGSFIIYWPPSVASIFWWLCCIPYHHGGTMLHSMQHLFLCLLHVFMYCNTNPNFSSAFFLFMFPTVLSGSDQRCIQPELQQAAQHPKAPDPCGRGGLCLQQPQRWDSSACG